jgi:hypothetical protein
MEFEERADSITIPKNTGLSGLLQTIKALLTEIPRVKELKLTSAGVLSYTWFAPTDIETRPLHVPFETLQPYSIVRNSLIEEVAVPTQQALLLSLFATCQRDKLYPICFVLGSKSIFWEWLMGVNGVSMPRDSSIFGYPLLMDEFVPNDTLLLCTGYARSQHIEDTYLVYKALMEMPHAE